MGSEASTKMIPKIGPKAMDFSIDLCTDVSTVVAPFWKPKPCCFGIQARRGGMRGAFE